MSLAVIIPAEIDATMLIGSTVAEDTLPAWSNATTYAAGDQVHLASTHRRYQSLQAGNLDKDPATQAAWWVDIGPSNRWAMFDNIVQSATVDAGPIVVNLQPGPVGGVLLARLHAARVRVVMRDEPGGTVVYDETKNLEAVPVIDWYTWTTAPFKYRTECAFVGLPPYSLCELEITITPIGSEPVEVGVLAAGPYVELGLPLAGISLGAVNYSRVVTDDYGIDRFTPRASARELDFELQATVQQLDAIAVTLTEAYARPHGFVPSRKDRYSSLIVWGVCESWKSSLPEADVVSVRGRIRGLT